MPKWGMKIQYEVVLSLHCLPPTFLDYCSILGWYVAEDWNFPKKKWQMTSVARVSVDGFFVYWNRCSPKLVGLRACGLTSDSRLLRTVAVLRPFRVLPQQKNADEILRFKLGTRSRSLKYRILTREGDSSHSWWWFLWFPFEFSQMAQILFMFNCGAKSNDVSVKTLWGKIVKSNPQTSQLFHGSICKSTATTVRGTK